MLWFAAPIVLTENGIALLAAAFGLGATVTAGTIMQNGNAEDALDFSAGIEDIVYSLNDEGDYYADSSSVGDAVGRLALTLSHPNYRRFAASSAEYKQGVVMSEIYSDSRSRPAYPTQQELQDSCRPEEDIEKCIDQACKTLISEDAGFVTFHECCVYTRGRGRYFGYDIRTNLLEPFDLLEPSRLYHVILRIKKAIWDAESIGILDPKRRFDIIREFIEEYSYLCNLAEACRKCPHM